MNLGEAVQTIKNKAEYIDLVVLYENPETYYNEIVEIIHIIKNMDEPILLDLNNKANAWVQLKTLAIVTIPQIY